jgi:hypothetical protein
VSGHLARPAPDPAAFGLPAGGGNPVDGLLFGLNIASTISGLLNWLKLLPPQDSMPFVVAGIDGTIGFAVGFLDILLAMEADSPSA